MPETKEIKDTLVEKLEYIGLNLNEIPKCLSEFTPLNFRPIRGYDERAYKVYEYVSVKNIEILITPINKDEDLEQRYKLAAPIQAYLNPDKEEYIRNYTAFLGMVKDMNISKIKEIEDFQEKVQINPPYEVKYRDNYLWQVFYSDYADKYFMLIPEKEFDNSALFFLIKKKLEVEKNNNDYRIYLPISHMEYSESLLNRDQIVDMENYLWIFTKDWPSIYEVYDNQDRLSLNILGKTKVYEKISSDYKIELNTKKMANEYFNLIKAMFILETDSPHRYKFKAVINEKGAIEFKIKDKVLSYDNISDFLKNEVIEKNNDSKLLNKELKQKNKELEELKEIAEKQNKEYEYKQKQIATFLECKKSFFGRVRFFFKKKKAFEEEEVQKKTYNEKEEKEEISIANDTIEDLLVLCNRVDKYEKEIKKREMDIDAIKNTIKSMKKKIENAGKYIEEIEEHKKSLFEFLRYTNKNEAQALNEGEETEENTTKKVIEKSFDYEDDIDELGQMMDKLQRKNLTKTECESVFAIEYIIGDIKQNLENLKNELKKKEEEYQYKNFDIFGAILQDQTKVRFLNSVKHREVERDKFEVLKITQNTTIDEFKEIIQRYEKITKKALKKIETPLNISVFSLENNNDLSVCDINPYNEIKNRLMDKDEKIELYRIDIPEKTNAIFYSNIIYYDNKNQTLPYGMNLSSKVLIDMNQSFKEYGQEEFCINVFKNDFEYTTKKIIVHNLK